MERPSFSHDYIAGSELTNFWTHETLNGISFSCGINSVEGQSNILQLEEGDMHAAIIAGDDTGNVLDSVLTSAMCMHKSDLLTIDFIVDCYRLPQIAKYNIKGMHTGRTFTVDTVDGVITAAKQLSDDINKRIEIVNKLGAFNLHGARSALLEKYSLCVNSSHTWEEMMSADICVQRQAGESVLFSTDWSRHLVVIYPFTTLFPACNEKAFSRLEMMVKLGRAAGYHFLFIADDIPTGKISIDDRLACMQFASMKIFGNVDKDLFERVTECAYIDELRDGNTLSVFEFESLGHMYRQYDYDVRNLNHLLWCIRKTHKGASR